MTDETRPRPQSLSDLNNPALIRSMNFGGLVLRNPDGTPSSENFLIEIHYAPVEATEFLGVLTLVVPREGFQPLV